MLNHFPPNVYDEKLGAYTTYDEKFKSQLTASESLGINSNFQTVRKFFVYCENNNGFIGPNEETEGVVATV